jgi:cytochrome c2
MVCGWSAGCLLDKDGDAMLADAEEQLGGGLVAEIGEIGSVEGGVCGEVLREVEAEGTLERWLADPDAFVPGNDMDFLVTRPEERKDLIAYLKQSSGK